MYESDGYQFHTNKLDLSNDVLSLVGIVVDDDNVGETEGDSDRKIDAGETINLGLTIFNSGLEDLSVQGTLLTNNTRTTVLEDNKSYGVVQSNTEVTNPDLFLLHLSLSYLSGTSIPFILNLTTSSEIFLLDFSLVIEGGVSLTIQATTITDDDSYVVAANEDDILNPGEAGDLEIWVSNFGGATVYSLEGLLTTTDPYITILDDFSLIGSIGSNESQDGRFIIQVSLSCPVLHEVTFLVNLTDQKQNYWERQATLVVNGTPSFILEELIIDDDKRKSDVYDSSFGDEDGLVDAGEIVELDLIIRNVGNIDVSGAYLQMEEDSDDIYTRSSRIYHGIVPTGTAINGSRTYNYPGIAFEVEDDINPSTTLLVNFLIHWGTSKVTIPFNITLTGVPNFTIMSLTIDDDTEVADEYDNSHGDGDGVIDSGEMVELGVVLANNGSADVADLTITMSEESPYIYSYSGETYIEVLVGGGGINNTIRTDYHRGITVEVEEETPANTQIPLTFVVEWGGFRQELHHSLTVVGVPIFSVTSVAIDDDVVASDDHDDSRGDGDGNLDSGEVVELELILTNTGTADTSDVLVSVRESSPYLTVSANILSVGQLKGGGGFNTSKRTADYYGIQLIVAEDAPANTTLTLTFLVRWGDFEQEINASLLIIDGVMPASWLDDALSDEGIIFILCMGVFVLFWALLFLSKRFRSKFLDKRKQRRVYDPSEVKVDKFSSEAEFREAQRVGANSPYQLELVRRYRAPDYRTVMKIEAGGFPSYEDYKSAAEVDAKTMEDFILVQLYKAPNYSIAKEIDIGGFPDYDTFLELKSQGFDRYRDWELQNIRRERLFGLVRRVNRMSRSEFKEYMEFDDNRKFLDWIIRLPKESPLRLDGDQVKFDQGLSSDRELLDSIDNLMRSYETTGKKEIY